jgi:hypothetical protein
VQSLQIQVKLGISYPGLCLVADCARRGLAGFDFVEDLLDVAMLSVSKIGFLLLYSLAQRGG